MRCTVPLIEVTNNANAFCIRGPDAKSNSTRAFVSHHLRTQFFVDVFVFAFAEEMQIEFAECGREIGR